MPDWPGRASFAGELIHSADYRNANAYRGRDVLVVGSGNSGAEIATAARRRRRLSRAAFGAHAAADRAPLTVPAFRLNGAEASLLTHAACSQ